MSEGTRFHDGMEQVFQIDKAKIRGRVDQVVQVSVEETLNALLDAEAAAEVIRRAGPNSATLNGRLTTMRLSQHTAQCFSGSSLYGRLNRAAS